VSAPLERTRYPGVFKRGRRYVYIYRDAGKRQRSGSAATLAEARAKRSTELSKVAHGRWREPSKTTFAEYATQWVRTYAGRTSRGLRESTREDYARTLGIDPSTGESFDPPTGAVAFFSSRRLSEIRPSDVKRYAAEVAGRGVSRDTVRLALAPVKALLATAVEDDLLDSNPAAGLRIAQAVGHVPDPEQVEKAKALSEDELSRLVAEAAPEWRLLIAFLGATGLRPSEARALRWRDLDFGRRRVKVRRSVNRGRVGPPKTRFGRRDVPLPAGLAQALWNERKTRKGADDAPVFARPSGAAVTREVAYRAVKAAAQRAGVPWAGLKTLRHTCASILFRRGYNAKQVQVWLGHHSAAFTLATYVHLLPEDLPEPHFLDELLPLRVITDVTTAGLVREEERLRLRSPNR
jgi:integrase